ncbi:MAG: NADH dehydrogenase subunit [Hyphomicrobiales bacterium]|nr:NADH dehydrogenase subunit [Hyphomicrobiales bacterium]MCP5371295.1 NADH dehydrogenase subunit [Hyphomicrobiales bacterium]
MTSLDLLMAIAAAATVLLYLFGTARLGGYLATLLHGAALAVTVAMGLDLAAGAGAIPSSLRLTVLGQQLAWTLDGLGWFFLLLTTGAAFFSSWYMAGEWGRVQQRARIQHGTLALNVLTMVLLLSAGDLLGLFIGWEFVSWAAFAMMIQAGGPATQAAYRYMLYALAGAMALFAAILVVHGAAGGFGFDQMRAALPDMSTGMLWTLFALFAGGFGVKMALVPTHLWQAPAYSYTPGASSAFLNAVSARMGLFALILSLVKLIGFDTLAGLRIPMTGIESTDILAWVAAITMVVPTYIALMQTDARMLLTWHGIGQGGYMLLGILVATPLGVAGGLLHVFNYATYQMALILAVFAVIHRTGTADLDELGGLITRMPLTYVALLMGIIGLAGLPPMNGFVSKWMIYKALIVTQQPLLSIAAFVGTLGTILSVYKLIHNIFLGQLRVEHREIREAPWSMTLPMLVLAGIGFVTGFAPGLALSIVDQAQAAMGVALLPHHLGGVVLATGSLNMLWVVGVLVGAIGVGALIFYVLGNRRFETHQYDNYAGGHFLSADIRYHFSHEFYPGLARVIGPWYRGWVVRMEHGLGVLAEVSGDLWHGVFRAAYTPLYVLIVAVLGLFWAGGAGGFGS